MRISKIKKKKTPMELLFDKIYGCKDVYKRSSYLRNGYIYVWCSKHPYSYKGLYPEHRFVLEKKIGRFLKPGGECCHHLDRNRKNNDPDNLVLCATTSEHMRKYHSTQFDPVLIENIKELAKDRSLSRSDISKHLKVNICTVKSVILNNDIEWIGRDEHIFSEDSVRKLIDTHTKQQLAEHFGVHESTLSRKFPILFPSRELKGHLEPHKEEILFLRESGLSFARIAEKFGSNKNTIRVVVLRWLNPEKTHRKDGKKEEGFLDEYRQEICELLSKGAMLQKIAQKFDTNRTTLNVAIQRWSRQGVLHPEAANRLNSSPHRRQKV